MKFFEVDGDVTNPVVKTGTRCIVHCTNQLGVWGSGVVVPIKKKWPEVCKRNLILCQAFVEYNELLDSKVHPFQGQIQPIKADANTIVVNAFAQSHIGNFFEMKAGRYQALQECCIRIREYLVKNIKGEVTLHFPAILCGLAGGKKSIVKPIITRTFEKTDLNIYWYNFK